MNMSSEEKEVSQRLFKTTFSPEETPIKMPVTEKGPSKAAEMDLRFAENRQRARVPKTLLLSPV